MSRMTFAAAALLLVTGCAAPGQRASPPPTPITETRTRRPRPVPPPPVAVRRPPPTRQAEPPPLEIEAPVRATVIIDAGHGGKDPGARGVSTAPEKTITLDIARKLASTLRRRGANVVMTRTDDTFVSLDGRAAMAERHHVDVFISIHADSAPRASASGATVYIARNASKRSRSVAEQLNQALQRAGIKTRGINKAGFRVLVGHSRPSVLVECGFLTNASDARQLNDGAYQSKLIRAIADGLAREFR